MRGKESAHSKRLLHTKQASTFFSNEATGPCLARLKRMLGIRTLSRSDVITDNAPEDVLSCQRRDCA